MLRCLMPRARLERMVPSRRSTPMGGPPQLWMTAQDVRNVLGECEYPCIHGYTWQRVDVHKMSTWHRIHVSVFIVYPHVSTLDTRSTPYPCIYVYRVFVGYRRVSMCPRIHCILYPWWIHVYPSWEDTESYPGEKRVPPSVTSVAKRVSDIEH